MNLLDNLYKQEFPALHRRILNTLLNKKCGEIVAKNSLESVNMVEIHSKYAWSV